ncbi:MAG: hypothetical protein KUG81_03505 [Gammaproteobacteria bacterium]|nr:hypothetical protein [Gammaproteobacteria bacterium]
MIDLLLHWVVYPFFTLWIFFIVAMYLKAYEEKIPDGPLRWLAALWVITGYLLDICFNYIGASILFWSVPESGSHTLSERLRDILFEQTDIDKFSFRWWMAYYICKYMIETFDKGHCDLDKLS